MNAQVNPFLFESATLTHLPNYGAINTTQLAGYLSVGDAAGGWLYFWFSEASINPEQAPLLLWVNSHPVENALFNLFDEHGPYLLDANGRVYSNPFSWHHHVNYLIIDQPLGNGLSFSTHPRYLPDNYDEAAQQLYHALQEFLLRWPCYRQQDFYLFGCGSAGHTIARLASSILDGNGYGQPEVRLKGLGLGNGQISPQIQLPSYIEYAYQHRLINLEEKHRALEMLQDFSLAQASPIPLRRAQASRIATAIENYIQQCSGRDKHDIRQPPGNHRQRLGEYLAKPAVQQALHIDPRSRNELQTMPQQLLDASWLDDSAHLFPRLLDQLKVLLYHGEYCMEGNYLGMDVWLNNLLWSKASNFRQQKRQSWRPYGLAAGLIRQHQQLSQVIIQNAGLRAARDQPAIVLAMLRDFLQNGAENPGAAGEPAS
ncbi:S10 family serine carboxypeptidase-like protein [Chromobacterium sphagni]|uniref:S10 family serine carboxypeptidase-like protein n=1 Tax=Chromobacterium sphagni TaxID=1903179 RepID=UPI0008D92825|nr:hypothetical protein [Chromobacterium sphagni]